LCITRNEGGELNLFIASDLSRRSESITNCCHPGNK
jgi:hypothetical protein